MLSNHPTPREVYETTFETDTRERLRYRDDSEVDVIKHDIDRAKDLFHALLNTLTPEQLTKVHEYMNK
jgi:hypothetical protein